VGRSRRSLTRVRPLALVAAIALAASIARADGLLYRPGDVILLQHLARPSPVNRIVALNPATLAMTPISAGQDLSSDEVLLSGGFDENGDILVLISAPNNTSSLVRVDAQTGTQTTMPTTIAGGCNPSGPLARLGDLLYVPTATDLLAVDLATGDATPITQGGFLVTISALRSQTPRHRCCLEPSKAISFASPLRRNGSHWSPSSEVRFQQRSQEIRFP